MRGPRFGPPYLYYGFSMRHPLFLCCIATSGHSRSFGPVLSREPRGPSLASLYPSIACHPRNTFELDLLAFEVACHPSAFICFFFSLRVSIGNNPQKLPPRSLTLLLGSSRALVRGCVLSFVFFYWGFSCSRCGQKCH